MITTFVLCVYFLLGQSAKSSRPAPTSVGFPRCDKPALRERGTETYSEWAFAKFYDLAGDVSGVFKGYFLAAGVRSERFEPLRKLLDTPEAAKLLDRCFASKDTKIRRCDEAIAYAYYAGFPGMSRFIASTFPMADASARAVLSEYALLPEDRVDLRGAITILAFCSLEKSPAIRISLLRRVVYQSAPSVGCTTLMAALSLCYELVKAGLYSEARRAAAHCIAESKELGRWFSYQILNEVQKSHFGGLGAGPFI